MGARSSRNDAPIQRVMDTVMFPVPESSYDAWSYPDEFLWIPRYGATRHTLPNLVPCLWLGCTDAVAVIVYFHGNGEDMGSARDMWADLTSVFRAHVVLVEYPGYGVSVGSPNEETVLDDCRAVVDYLKIQLGVPAQQMVLVGRSIGSGSALQLATEDHYCAVVTISAYTSIRQVIKHVAGSFVASVFPGDRFVSIDRVAELRCPAAFIHGVEDTLIPCHHSEELYANCSSEWKDLVIVEGMDHNNVFDPYFIRNYLVPTLGEILEAACPRVFVNVTFPVLATQIPRDV